MIGGKIEDGDLEGNLEAEQNIGIDGEGAPTAYCRVFYFDISESHYYSFLFVESMLQPGTFCSTIVCWTRCLHLSTCIGLLLEETTCLNILSAKIIRSVLADIENIDAKIEDFLPRVTE